MSGKKAEDAIQRITDKLSSQRDYYAQRELWLLGSALAGSEITLFGRRSRLSIEWLDGPPPGMTEGDLRRMGEKMRAD